MRHIRVRTENGELYESMLRAAGHEAKWLGPGTASVSLHSGCTDPSCCSQHDARYDPQAWGAIETDASGTVAHKLWTQNSACRL